MIKLSIVIPVYNAQRYLKDCLDSIVSEMDENIELIIIDDGSTDDSFKIYNNYISNNIHVYQNSNHGVSYSRNFGIEKASGKYVSFVDADDFLTKGWKDILLNIINRNDNDIIFINKDLKYTEMTKEKILDYIFQIDNSVKWISTPWSKIFKVDFLNRNKIRFLDNVVNGEDMLFNAESLLKCNKYSFIKNNIYNYRINNFSVTKTFKDNIFSSDKLFLKKLQKLFIDDLSAKKKYTDFCVENAIIMFIRKLSFIEYRFAKNYFYIFEENPYKSYLEKFSFNSYKKFELLLVKYKKYKLALAFTIFKRKISGMIKNKNKDEIIVKI